MCYYTYLGGIVRGTEDELRSAVVARADVRDVGLGAHQVFCGPEVAQLQNARLRIEQQVLRLDVPVAYTQRMDVREAPEQLVHV